MSEHEPQAGSGSNIERGVCFDGLDACQEGKMQGPVDYICVETEPLRAKTREREGQEPERHLKSALGLRWKNVLRIQCPSFMSSCSL